MLLLPSGELFLSFGRIDVERGINQKIIVTSRDHGRT